MTRNKDNERIHILFSTNSGYAMPMTVSITSIFENNKKANEGKSVNAEDRDITVHVFFSDLTDDQKERLSALADQYGQKINLVHIADHYFADTPALRWSKETYYRLLICDILPADINRIIYLDCDIVVNKDIRELYDMNMEGQSLAMYPEHQSAEAFSKRLGLKSQKYFQAGVILFDMEKVRPILSYSSSLKTLEAIGEKLVAVDQDVVNLMFDGKIASLPKKFNNCDVTNFNGSAVSRLFNRAGRDEIANATVFHFATGKPWNNLYSGSAEQVWYEYLKLSPYKNLYEEKYSGFKYKLLRTGIIKTFFFSYIYLTPIINGIAASLFPKGLYQRMRRFYRAYIK